jgi:protocatechuate 3,4-dioxygenase, alpha subunit
MHKNQHIQTPSQTVGPFFAYGLTAEDDGYKYSQIVNGKLLTGNRVDGERITITGSILDGAGNLIPDAMIEIWQADVSGRYDSRLFVGFGRASTGSSKDSRFRFDTIKPGSVRGAAPHINLVVFMRGLLVHAFTRLYFSDERNLNENDEVLNNIPAERRHTVIAQRNDGQNEVSYHFDIYMQGENETVFFDI